MFEQTCKALMTFFGKKPHVFYAKRFEYLKEKYQGVFHRYNFLRDLKRVQGYATILLHKEQSAQVSDTTGDATKCSCW